MRVTGKPRDVHGDVEVPVRVHTRLFGTLHERLHAAAAGQRHRCADRLVALARVPRPASPASSLSRHTTLPRRATLLARDGSVLAEGAALRSRTARLAARLARERGGRHSRARSRPPAGGRWKAEGVPADAIVGVSGLELALDSSLRGTPGGELLAATHDRAGIYPRARLRHAEGGERRAHDRLPGGAARRGHGARADSSAGSSRWRPPRDRSWPSPVSVSTTCNRRARRSR